jgi:pilus assembly protein CpaE
MTEAVAATPDTPQGTSGPQVIVYTADQDAAGVIRQAVSDAAPDAVFKSAGLRQALTDMGNQPSPRLLIVDAAGVDDPVSRVHDLIDMCGPSTALLVIGDLNDIRLYRSMKETGVTDYFFKPLVMTLLANRCLAILTGKQDAVKRRTGRLVFVVGACGGCGATTIAIRTAMRLAQAPPRPVLMLDLNLRCGDSALQFDVTPSHALREALAQPERVDDLFLERGLIHATKRLDLMASLEPLDSETNFDETALMALLDKVTPRYRYIVIDLPAYRVPALTLSLHLPSTLLLVSDGRLVSAREVARWHKWLGANTAERTLVHILNMDGAPGSLDEADFTRAAGASPDVLIPYSRDVGANALLGLKAAPDCPVLDEGLEPVLGMLAGGVAAHKRSWLQRLLARL